MIIFSRNAILIGKFFLLLISVSMTLLWITGCKTKENSTATRNISQSNLPTIQPTTIETDIPTTIRPSTTATKVPTPTKTPTSVEIKKPTATPLPAVTIPTLPSSNLDCASAGLPNKACTGVTANHEWQPLIQDFDGFLMALVPAGCFVMGNNAGAAEEQPAHGICVQQPFWIDQTEVTVDQYTRFMNENKKTEEDVPIWINLYGDTLIQMIQKDGIWVPTPGDQDRPVESISYEIAVEFCTWRGGRLLTEAEWEYAARGPEALLYPWGNDFVLDNVVRIYDETPNTGSKPGGASWVGALDMSSSLFEWVSSIYLPYPYDFYDGREAPLEIDNQSERVLRGGSWYHGDGVHDNLTTTARINVPPRRQFLYFGFRCALEIDL